MILAVLIGGTMGVVVTFHLIELVHDLMLTI